MVAAYAYELLGYDGVGSGVLGSLPYVEDYLYSATGLHYAHSLHCINLALHYYFIVLFITRRMGS